MPDRFSKKENLMGALAYLAGPLFLFTEKENKLIRFHAMQATMFIVFVFLSRIVLEIVPVYTKTIGFLLNPVLEFVLGAYYLFVIYKAYKGEKFKIPYIGNAAEKQLLKMKI